MPDIVLTTFNARYAHTSFGLRYLMANLGPFAEQAVIREFVIHERPADALERVLADNPRIVGLGVYIWNAVQSLELVTLLKRVRPDITVVVGGPEVSYEIEDQAICQLADYVVSGEADVAFRGLCAELLAGRRPPEKVVTSPLPEMQDIALPYDLYSDEDVANRVVYVEASRGCPYKCQFCLSSLDIPVRQIPLERFLAAMDKLFVRGVRHFKFVDRTFNLKTRVGLAILEFFRERYEPGLFLHFEMIPDRLPAELREVISHFPPGTLQFEVGIQTFDPDVSARIERRQNLTRLEDNLQFLRTQTGVHVHADLIVGLPGESVETFAAGFDRLVALGPQEIQVGILKRLRGTPISMHDEPFEMVYSPNPPYEILTNDRIDFGTMQRMKRFAQAWDRVVNSGNFRRSAPLIWANGSPFECFAAFTDWLFADLGRVHGLSLQRLVDRLFVFLTQVNGHDAETVAPLMLTDYHAGGRTDVPLCLRAHTPSRSDIPRPRDSRAIPRRQMRHLE